MNLVALAPTSLLWLSGRASGLESEGHRFHSCWEYSRNFSSEPPVSLKNFSFILNLITAFNLVGMALCHLSV